MAGVVPSFLAAGKTYQHGGAITVDRGPDRTSVYHTGIVEHDSDTSTVIMPLAIPICAHFRIL